MVNKGVGVGYFIKDIIENHNSNNYNIVSFDDLPSVDVCCVYLSDFLTAASKKFIELLVNNK